MSAFKSINEGLKKVYESDSVQGLGFFSPEKYLGKIDTLDEEMPFTFHMFVGEYGNTKIIVGYLQDWDYPDDEDADGSEIVHLPGTLMKVKADSDGEPDPIAGDFNGLGWMDDGHPYYNREWGQEIISKVSAMVGSKVEFTENGMQGQVYFTLTKPEAGWF